METIFTQPWPFWAGGLGVGLCVVLLAWVTGKSLGVSSAFGSVCGMVSGLPHFSKPPYTDKWRMWFVVGIPLGGLLSAALTGDLAVKQKIGAFESLFGDSMLAKGAVLSIGGFLIGYGSRWAGG